MCAATTSHMTHRTSISLESEELPLSQKNQDGAKEEKKKKKKRIDFRPRVTTDGPTKSLSLHNSDMDVMASMIGHSVVHRTQKTGQKILCLDGGGVKVGDIEIPSTDCDQLGGTTLYFGIISSPVVLMDDWLHTALLLLLSLTVEPHYNYNIVVTYGQTNSSCRGQVVALWGYTYIHNYIHMNV